MARKKAPSETKGALRSYRFSAITDERLNALVARFNVTRTAALEAAVAHFLEALDQRKPAKAKARIESAKKSASPP